MNLNGQKVVIDEYSGVLLWHKPALINHENRFLKVDVKVLSLISHQFVIFCIAQCNLISAH